MKLVMDEKLKHRLIGLAVILSLGAIFAPAVVKKSNQGLDHHFSVQVKLPPKPLAPDVLSSDEKELFRTIRIAKVKMPAAVKKEADPELKAESLSTVRMKEQQNAVHVAINEAASRTVKTIIQTEQKTAKPPRMVAFVHQKADAAIEKSPKVKVETTKPAPIKLPVAQTKAQTNRGTQEIYAVQLASFAQLANAQALVTRLESKGYKANYTKSSGRSGTIYKVFVGHSTNKLEVMKLQTQLANAMQLKGFIVNTRVLNHVVAMG